MSKPLTLRERLEQLLEGWKDLEQTNHERTRDDRDGEVARGKSIAYSFASYQLGAVLDDVPEEVT